MKPTVSGDNPMGLEVWIFDFREDIYGKKIRAHLVSYLRPERKFDSMDQLKEQISDLEKLLHEYRTGQILEKK